MYEYNASITKFSIAVDAQTAPFQWPDGIVVTESEWQSPEPQTGENCGWLKTDIALLRGNRCTAKYTALCQSYTPGKTSFNRFSPRS